MTQLESHPLKATEGPVVDRQPSVRCGKGPLRFSSPILPIDPTQYQQQLKRKIQRIISSWMTIDSFSDFYFFYFLLSSSTEIIREYSIGLKTPSSFYTYQTHIFEKLSF